MGQLQHPFGLFHHPNGNSILPFPAAHGKASQSWRSWHGRRPRKGLKRRGDETGRGKRRGMRMKRARGEVRCIDWCVKGFPGAPLLRDSPGRCKAGINNCSIGALFALLAQSRRTLVAAYRPAESPRNAVTGKCARSHDIY